MANKVQSEKMGANQGKRQQGPLGANWDKGGTRDKSGPTRAKWWLTGANLGQHASTAVNRGEPGSTRDN